MTEHPGERPEIEAPQRKFAPRGPPPGGLRDIEAFERAIKLKAGLWGGAIGFFGTGISMLLAVKVGAEPPWSYLFLLGGPLAGVLVYKMVMGITESSGAAVGKIHPLGAIFEWLGIGAVGIALAFSINPYFGFSGLALWIMGVFYNIPPLRTKEVPYLDVISDPRVRPGPRTPR